MNTNKITVSGIDVLVVRKKIKNLHLAVYPPHGRVRVAVPEHISDDHVRLSIISRLPWIHKQQARYQKQPRQSERQMVSGESHYLFGKKYRLDVVERYGRHEVVIKNNSTLQLFVKPGTNTANKLLAMNEWYRGQFKTRIPMLLEKWQPILGVEVSDCGVRKMRTKWGSCRINRRRIWLNLELAKKSSECLEYIVIHELVHLLERHHNERFRSLMDKFLPLWRVYRDILKKESLAHEDWKF